ncbi:MAG: hypothetical protein A2V79_00680 [Betaproteobacteria bacterium RBG_16_56_24]|nr:MAG: hypothetical protein A2V79_00680 [Betaproteobacteria bacterium RBG_16_56_24]
MNSSTIKIAAAVIASVTLWLLGGLFFGHVVGMICVLLGVAIAGYTAGVIMDTPCPSTTGEK